MSSPQRHMHGGAPFGVVEGFAREQRFAPRFEIARFRKRNEQRDRLARHFVLGEVEDEIVELDAEIFEPRRVLSEEVERSRPRQSGSVKLQCAKSDGDGVRHWFLDEQEVGSFVTDSPS
jgi:hypothetical protein